MPAREDTRIDPSQLVGITALCIDNEPSVLDGMETLLRSWSCEVIKAPDLETALAVIGESHLMPNGLLVDYHLDHGNGIEAITELRRRFGDLPAILITADRSPSRTRRGADPRNSTLAQANQASCTPRAIGAMAHDARRCSGVAQSAFSRRALRPVAAFNLGGGDNSLGPAFNAKLLQNRGDMCFHRRLGDAELKSDLLIQQSFR